MSTPKKSKAVPSINPCGLSAREVEIAVLAWKCVDADGKASNESHHSFPKSHQINNQNLADLTHIPKAESASRMWRGIKAKIIAATSDSDAGPGTPATPATPNGGSTAAVAAADPGSPSLLASKKKKAAAASGKVAGRKRTMKEADGDDDDDDAGDVKAEGGERPKKAAKRVKSTPIVTLKKEPGEGAVQLEAGEV